MSFILRFSFAVNHYPLLQLENIFRREALVEAIRKSSELFASVIVFGVQSFFFRSSRWSGVIITRHVDLGLSLSEAGR